METERYKLEISFRLIGKYNPGHGVCYVSEEGKEVAVRDFQVLVAFHGNKLSAAVSAVKKALALVDKSTTERSGIFVTSPVSKLWAKKTSKKTFRKRFSANYPNYHSFSLRPLLRSMRYDIWSPFNISVPGNVCLTKLSFELISPFNAIIIILFVDLHLY